MDVCMDPYEALLLKHGQEFQSHVNWSETCKLSGHEQNDYGPQ